MIIYVKSRPPVTPQPRMRARIALSASTRTRKMRTRVGKLGMIFATRAGCFYTHTRVFHNRARNAFR
jgi:hypothetical protein